MVADTGRAVRAVGQEPMGVSAAGAFGVFFEAEAEGEGVPLLLADAEGDGETDGEGEADFKEETVVDGAGFAVGPGSSDAVVSIATAIAPPVTAMANALISTARRRFALLRRCRHRATRVLTWW
jgi:hypothetical protein